VHWVRVPDGYVDKYGDVVPLPDFGVVVVNRIQSLRISALLPTEASCARFTNNAFLYGTD
jgi:hypothetical protein